MPRLFAFLSRDAVAFLSGFRWPVPAGDGPGDWVRAGVDAPPEVVRGVPLEQLPWWLDEELWEVELEGRLESGERAVRGERGRLTRRVTDWTPEVADELVTALEERVRGAGHSEYADDVRLYAADAARPAAAAGVAAYVAAHALAGADKARPGYEAEFERERNWQVEWLKRRLRL